MAHKSPALLYRTYQKAAALCNWEVRRSGALYGHGLPLLKDSRQYGFLLYPKTEPTSRTPSVISFANIRKEKLNCKRKKRAIFLLFLKDYISADYKIENYKCCKTNNFYQSTEYQHFNLLITFCERFYQQVKSAFRAL